VSSRNQARLSGIIATKSAWLCASKGNGKSGGARLITYVQVVNETVFLLALYDESEQSSVSDQQVLALLDLLGE
jgi:hypothetical protein